MYKIAIVESEQNAKDIIFALSKVLDDEFTFIHYEKISELVKDSNLRLYDLIILNKTYNTTRVSNALEYQKNNMIIIYCDECDAKRIYEPYSRIFTINMHECKRDLNKIKDYLQARLSQHNIYYFSYNGVKVFLKYQDIIYVEKDLKNLVYHTKKGEFHERGNISQKEVEFEPYDFVRINSGILVNYEYIFRIYNDEVELKNHISLPISRKRKARLNEFIRNKIK